MDELRKHIRAEKVEGRSLAVVYDGGELGKEILVKLRAHGLRVIFVDSEKADFPVLEKPDYIVYFVSSRSFGEWREVVMTAKRVEARLILCLENISEALEERLMKEAKEANLKIRLVEIRGKLLDKGEISLAADKIVHKIFSSEDKTDRLLLVGKKIEVIQHKNYAPDVTAKPIKKKGKVEKWVAILSLVIIIFFLPLIIAAIFAGFGFLEIRSGTKLLASGKLDQAKITIDQAQAKLATAAEFVTIWGKMANVIGLGQTAESFYEILLVGQAGTNTLAHGVTIAKTAGQMLSKSDLNEAMVSIKPELSAIDQELGKVLAQWGTVSSLGSKIGPWVGLSEEKLEEVKNKIIKGRGFLSRTNDFIDVLPIILGQSGLGKKTYLVVLQNSSELRPTGGFIGSYAIVNFDSGRFLDFKINDIYSADGQLRGRIAPPDEILHYLGQPSWFMRDANWAPDWPLTAKRLEWFLEKETGQKVSGVWAVSLPAVQKLLGATGELALRDLNQTVSATDFYSKAEFTSEINFFPGSTQKRDFLGATAQALLEKLLSDTDKDWFSISQAIGQALLEKDVMLYFDDENIQKIVEKTGWSGEINANHCGDAGTNCLMVVDANMGANKSNFFLSRKIVINSVISKDGVVENRVNIQYLNNSPSLSWPGGIYKNYVRFLVPVDSQFSGFDLGDGRKAIVSPILTADALSKIPQDSFLVFKNFELSAKTKTASDSAFLSFGAYFEVPVGETRTVSFSYRPGYKLNFENQKTNLPISILRQPGASVDKLDIIVDYPSFLQPETTEKALVLPQKLMYNTVLSEDKTYEINFLRR